jgi:hypothetical protein
LYLIIITLRVGWYSPLILKPDVVLTDDRQTGRCDDRLVWSIDELLTEQILPQCDSPPPTTALGFNRALAVCGQRPAISVTL